MLIKNVFFILLFASFGTIGFSQMSHSAMSKGSHPAIISFGGITNGGEIVIMNHMEDSLFFTDPETNSMYCIASFHMAVKCYGNVLKYIENISGNKLTTEMQYAVRELLPGCALTFDGIKAVCLDKNFGGWMKEFNPGMLKLILK
ncbi:hypothetical protein BH11BAC1_BH11BAC1_25750 [soil metagenome]